MQNDSPDTIAIEDTQWLNTQVDDVFLPSVRVQLGWRDLEAAVERGAVAPQMAHALWAGWAAPASGLRVGSDGLAPAFAATEFHERGDDLPMPANRGALQHRGKLLGLGLLAGVVLGAGGTWLALGG